MMKNRLWIVTIAATAVFFSGIFLLRSRSATFRIEDYQSTIETVAKENGLPPELLVAIVYVESKGNPDARSSAGAIGLMQIKPAAAQDAARWLGRSEPSDRELWDPETNLRLGSAYLKNLAERFDGDLDLAILAYYAGPGGLNKRLELFENRELFKESLRKEPGMLGEYLLEVRDMEERFKERWYPAK